MDIILRWLITWLLTFPAARSETIVNNVGFGLELILAKLELLEKEITSLKEQNQNLTHMLTKVIQGSIQVGSSKSSDHTEDDGDDRQVYPSCLLALPEQSGKFMIQPEEGIQPFQAYCDMQYKGGGWTVIQKRFNGSENFYRNWTAYKKGFGSLDGEFWFGLDRIHLLTKLNQFEIMFVLTDFKNTVRYAHYDRFEIGSDIEGYYIKELGSYDGTAGDSFTYHKHMKFSTYDVDNDIYTENCAKNYYGAWWYKSCFTSNLNGRYINARNDQSMSWNKFNNGNDGLKSSIIMIREI